MFPAADIGAAEAQADALASLVEGLAPEAVPLAEAPGMWRSFDRMERLAGGAKLLLAKRVDESGVWQRAGDRDAGVWLARHGGTSVTAARIGVAASKRLAKLPETAAALRAGRLSVAQAEPIADAASRDQEAEGRLLGLAEEASLSELREECGRVKAKADPDPERTYQRIRANRRLRHGTDSEGAAWLSGKGPVDDAAELLAVLEPVIDELFREARDEGRAEPREAYAWDALQEIARRAHDWAYNPTNTDTDADIDGEGADDSAGSDTDTDDDGDGDSDTGDDGDGEDHHSGTGTDDGAEIETADTDFTGGGAETEDHGDPDPDTLDDDGEVAGEDEPGACTSRSHGHRRDGDGGDRGDDGHDGDDVAVSADGDDDVDLVDAEPNDAVAPARPGRPGRPERPEWPGRPERPERERSGPGVGATRVGRPRRGRRRRMNEKYLALVRVDLEALARGQARDGERCEIGGVAVPVSVARQVLGESVVKLVLTRGENVATTVHLGRGPSAAQKIALRWLSPTCRVRGCHRTDVQWDHRIDWHKTHHTVLWELDGLCTHHHDLKTTKGWALLSGNGKRAMVAPTDPRHPSNSSTTTGPKPKPEPQLAAA